MNRLPQWLLDWVKAGPIHILNVPARGVVFCEAAAPANADLPVPGSEPTGSIVNCFSSVIESTDAAGLPREIMFAPAGKSTITAGNRNHEPLAITINVTPAAVLAINRCLDFYKSKTPSYRPFGDKNHEMKEATFWGGPVTWSDSFTDPATNAKCSGLVAAVEQWTSLGSDSILGKTLRCFSPALLTDYDESNTKKVGGIHQIPKGKRGSPENPAEIIGVMRCVGSLTNLPAFTTIAPIFAESPGAAPATPEEPGNPAAVAASTQPPPPAQTAPADKGVRTMPPKKIKLLKDRGTDLAGSTVSHLSADEMAAIVASGGGIYAEEAVAFAEVETARDVAREENDRLKKEVLANKRTRITDVITRAVKRGAVNPRQKVNVIVDGKDTEMLYTDRLAVMCESNPDMIADIEGRPGNTKLTERTVQQDKRDFARAGAGGSFDLSESGLILAEGCSVEEAVRGYAFVQAEARRADAAHEKPEIVDALRREAGRVFCKHLKPFIADGDYFGIKPRWFEGMPEEKGGVVLSANALGTLAATNIVAQNYMELLEEIFFPFLDLAFNLSSLGAVYEEVVITRWRGRPIVKSWDPANPGYFNSDGATYDIPVTLDSLYYTQFQVDAGTATSTTRDLFGEQLGAQLSGIGRTMMLKWINVMTIANFDKTAILGRTGYSIGGNPTRQTLTGIDNDLDTLLNNEEDRRVIFATDVYNALRNDVTLVSYFNAGPESNARSTGEIGRRENLWPSKSQLFNGLTNNVAGFAFTKTATAVATRIPITPEKSVGIGFGGVRDVITAPRTGVSILFTKWVAQDGGSASCRPEVLIGAAPGQPNAGLIVTR